MSAAPKHWQGRGAVALLLWPVSVLFGAVSRCRRWCYRSGTIKVAPSALPVIVVGNISVGGTGKTPLTQALVQQACQQGLRCGIVSRGHGGQAQSTPLLINKQSTASQVGDEPLLHFYKAGVPVVVCTDRSSAVSRLAQCDVNIAFSDDGLQHYRMARVCEIAVVDADAGFANALLLPSGPLREPLKRLEQVNIIAVQIKSVSHHPDSVALTRAVPELREAVEAGIPVGSFFLQAGKLRHLWSNETLPLSNFAGQAVVAVAGIGSPQRFFQSLRDANLDIQPIAFDDHHVYSEIDFQALPEGPIIVTGKDAVKIAALSLQKRNIYELEVEVCMSDSLTHAVQAVLHTLKKQQ